MALVRQSTWPTLRGSPLSDFFDDDTRREFGYSSFSRSFNFPANTSEEDIQAKYEEGVLKLIIA